MDIEQVGESSWAEVPGTLIRLFVARDGNKWEFHAYELEQDCWVAHGSCTSETTAHDMAETWAFTAGHTLIVRLLDWRPCERQISGKETMSP